MRVLFIRFAMNGTNARMLATAAAAAGGSGNIGCIAAAVNRFAIDAALQQHIEMTLISRPSWPSSRLIHRFGQLAHGNGGCH